jgi:non-ribosomal peptide synthetase component F
LGAYSHQDVPFDKLVELLQPERNLSHTPIFQVLFVMENFARTGRGFDDLEAEAMSSGFPTSKFDLSMFLREGPEGLRGHWVYRADLFDVSSIDRISGQFSALLTQLLQEPDQPIEDVKLRSDEDQLKAPVSEALRAGNLRGARRRVPVVGSVEPE